MHVSRGNFCLPINRAQTWIVGKGGRGQTSGSDWGRSKHLGIRKLQERIHYRWHFVSRTSEQNMRPSANTSPCRQFNAIIQGTCKPSEQRVGGSGYLEQGEHHQGKSLSPKQELMEKQKGSYASSQQWEKNLQRTQDNEGEKSQLTHLLVPDCGGISQHYQERGHFPAHPASTPSPFSEQGQKPL